MKLKNTFLLNIVLFLIILNNQKISAQTPGLIYKVTDPVNVILDPNSDGYVSKTTSGFLADDHAESEIPYISIPVLDLEPDSDPMVGPDYSYIDIIDNGTKKEALYVYYDDPNNSLLFRFRLGGTASNFKAYTIMVDSDQKFGFTGSEADPDAKIGNPGFEFEIVLETGIGVGLYNVDGQDYANEIGNAATIRPYASFAQKSIAFTTNNGNLDYFYDFYVPMGDLAVFGIDKTTPLRMVGATVMDSTAFIGSSEASDIGGTDEFYFSDIFECIPPIAAERIGLDNTDCRTPCPLIDVIADGATTVTGTSTSGYIIKLYVNGIYEDEITVLADDTWSISTAAPLNSGDEIKATATDGIRYVSFDDCDIEIVGSVCTDPPYNVSEVTPRKGVEGDINAPIGTLITLYNWDGTEYFDPGNITNPYTTTTVIESWDIAYSAANSMPAGNYYVTSQAPGQCESDPVYVCVGYSNTSAVPIISTDPVLTTTTIIDGTVGVSPGNMYIFNGADEIGNSSVSGDPWSVNISPSPDVCDNIFAMQIETGKCFAISAIVVAKSTSSYHKPVITGTYCVLSGDDVETVTGTSVEEAGSTIEIYEDDGTGPVFVGTTLVTANGTWLLGSISIPVGNDITAKVTDGSLCLSESPESDAVTVTQLSVNEASINEPVTEGSPTVSGSGSGSYVNLYQDGFYIGFGVISGGLWNVTGLNSNPETELYAGGVLTVTEVDALGLCESVHSTPAVIVQCNTPADDLTLSATVTEYCENEGPLITVKSAENDIIYTPVLTNGTTVVGYSGLGTGSDLILTLKNNTLPIGTTDITVKAEKLSGTLCESVNTYSISFQINSMPLTDRIVTPGTATICRGESLDIIIQSAEDDVSYQLKNAADDTDIGLPEVGDGSDLTISTGSIVDNIASLTIKISATDVDPAYSTNCSIDLNNTVDLTVNGPRIDQNVTVDDPTICQNNSTTIRVNTYNDGFYRVYGSINGLLDSFNGDGAEHLVSTGNLIPPSETFYVMVDDGVGCNVEVLNDETVTVNQCLTDIYIEKTVDDNTPDEGQTIFYNVTVTNNGPLDVTELEITDNLPVGLTYNPGATPAPPTGTTWSYPVWTIGAFANGDSETLTIAATVNAGTSGDAITNTASNTQYQTDDSANDVWEDITVTSTASLSVTQHGDEAGPTAIEYTVTLSADNNTGLPITFDFEDLLGVGTGTATNGSDYTAVGAGALITVLDGASTGTITIVVLDDAIFEPTETVDCQISNPSNNAVTITTYTATANIIDNESAPIVTLSAAPLSITENGGTSTITATLSDLTYEDVIVNLSYSGTAIGGGTDYNAATSITITAGNIDGTTVITAVDNAIYEGDKTVIADISAVSGGGASENGTQSETVTITEDESTPTVTLSAGTGTITENPVSTSILTAELSVATYENVTVNLSYSGNANGGGTDYSAAASILITAGNTTGTTVITSVDDAIYELNEDIIIDISGVLGGSAFESGNQSETVIITSDEIAPTVTLSSSTGTITENPVSAATLTATLSVATYENVTVSLSYSGSATGSGTDYTAAALITITAGTYTGTTVITSVDDLIYENDETVIVDISNVTGGGASGNGVQTVTITSDEGTPTVTLSAAPSPIAENGGISTLTATLSVRTYEDVIVYLSYAGTANGSGTDYNAAASITIAAGNLFGTTDITSVNDDVYEQDETVTIDISGVSGGDASENGTQNQTIIINDDADIPTITLSANPLTIAENGITSTLTATLSNATYENVIVDLSYSGTATGGGTDYIAGISITIIAGNTTGTTDITSVDDFIYENDETVIININTVTGGGASEDGVQTETVTITSDESTPDVTLSAAPSPIAENGGISTLTAELSVATYEAVTVNLSYTGNAAGGGTDYIAATLITITAGNLTGTTNITSVPDFLLETDETIITDISTITGGGALENGTQNATVIITDDENADAVLSVTTHGNETGPVAIEYTVTLSVENGTGSPITFNFADLGTGTAASGSDYTAPGTQISVVDGTYSGTITIAVTDDGFFEATETVICIISSPSNDDVTITTYTATANIIDDDEVDASLSVTTHGNETGEVAVEYTVTLSNDNNTDSAITFDFDDLLSGTASSGFDYTTVPLDAVISVDVGTYSGTITIPVTDDILYESTETINAQITSTSNTDVTITTYTVTANIIDNESINASLSVTTDGNEAGPVDIIYTVILTKTNNTGTPITFDFDDLLGAGTGTALSGTDYTAVPIDATISVADGTYSGTITIPVTDDSFFETDETVIARISGCTDPEVFINVDEATANIIDDETVDADLIVTAQGEENGEVAIEYTVTLNNDNNTGSAITFDFDDLFSGTASDGSDYTTVPPNAVISVAVGTYSGTITIPVYDDALFEADETVIIQINNCSNDDVTINTSSATAIIIDDEEATADLSVTTHGDENGPVDIVYTVSLSRTNFTGTAITFDFEDLFAGTAISGIDYTAVGVGAQILVTDGSDIGTITIPVTDDVLLEIIETVECRISNPSDIDVSITTYSATANIIDNETPTADLSVTTHGNENGPVDIIYTLTISNENSTGTPITFDFDDLLTGTAVSGTDYTAVEANAQITIIDGVSTGSIIIPVIDDIYYEPTETINAQISNPSNTNIIISAASATANIIDDDYADIVLTKTVDNNNPNEGDNITFTITVTNNGPSQLTDLTVTDELPVGLTFVSATSSTGIWTDPNWSVESLDAGSSETLTITANVDVGTSGTSITNTISNTQDQNDDNTTTDDDSETIIVNDIPDAVDDTETVDEDDILNSDVLTNDTGLSDGGIIVTVVTDVINGILELNSDGTYTYTPDADYHGSDSFVYEVCDTDNDCDQATVNITINSVNDLPIAQDDEINVEEDSELNEIFISEDNGNGEDFFGGDGPSIGAVELISNTENGTLEFNNNDTPEDPTDDYFIYTPEKDYYGFDSFEYEICDFDGDCDQAVVSIEVINDGVMIIPEVFTPNGDGINDLFIIEGLEIYPQNSILIFNRWGNKVFEASPYNSDWTGSSNFGITPGGNELPEGTYFYILKTDNEHEDIKGYIYLKK